MAKPGRKSNAERAAIAAAQAAQAGTPAADPVVGEGSEAGQGTVEQAEQASAQGAADVDGGLAAEAGAEGGATGDTAADAGGAGSAGSDASLSEEEQAAIVQEQARLAEEERKAKEEADNAELLRLQAEADKAAKEAKEAADKAEILRQQEEMILNEPSMPPIHCWTDEQIRDDAQRQFRAALPLGLTGGDLMQAYRHQFVLKNRFN